MRTAFFGHLPLARTSNGTNLFITVTSIVQTRDVASSLMRDKMQPSDR